jgi:hypothetical protein
MQLDTDEFIRRFMLHVLPSGFHRIRHFGLLANRPKMALAHKLLDAPAPEVQETSAKAEDEPAVFNCRKCQQPLEIIAITATFIPSLKADDRLAVLENRGSIKLETKSRSDNVVNTIKCSKVTDEPTRSLARKKTKNANLKSTPAHATTKSP